MRFSQFAIAAALLIFLIGCKPEALPVEQSNSPNCFEVLFPYDFSKGGSEEFSGLGTYDLNIGNVYTLGENRITVTNISYRDFLVSNNPSYDFKCLVTFKLETGNQTITFPVGDCISASGWEILCEKLNEDLDAMPFFSEYSFGVAPKPSSRQIQCYASYSAAGPYLSSFPVDFQITITNK